MSKAYADVKILTGDLKVAQQFSCQHCDFKTSTEVLLKEHIEVKHEPECKFCEKQFQTSELLEKHTCKLNINNAEFKEFYMKNWILTHGCSAVFSKHLQKEIAILHIDNCWKHICPCRELPAWHSLGEILDDENGILHAGRGDFIENGVVHWSALCKEM